jgi:hypothetical protein
VRLIAPAPSPRAHARMSSSFSSRPSLTLTSTDRGSRIGYSTCASRRTPSGARPRPGPRPRRGTPTPSRAVRLRYTSSWAALGAQLAVP